MNTFYILQSHVVIGEYKILGGYEMGEGCIHLTRLIRIPIRFDDQVVSNDHLQR